ARFSRDGSADVCSSDRLQRDERVDDIVRFIRRPPLGPGMGLPYAILFGGAVASLPKEFRRMLGLRRPWWPAITATRVALWTVERDRKRVVQGKGVGGRA